MNNELFLKIVLSFISILSAIITAYVIPMLKEKVNSERLDKLSYYITVAVRCAEQIFTPEEWKEKKQYVMDFALNKLNQGLNLSLNESDLDLIIEGIVNEIKHGDDFKKIENSDSKQ